MQRKQRSRFVRTPRELRFILFVPRALPLRALKHRHAVPALSIHALIAGYRADFQAVCTS
jgi:hypothetical protein